MNKQEAKHTPGPWEFDHTIHLKLKHFFTVYVDKHHESREFSTNCYDIHAAAADVGDVDLEVKFANARLIAAAPELLGALEDLLFTIQVTAIKHESQLPDLNRDADNARAAIAKATGKELAA